MITKDTPLTFGKYQGFTPTELAATDEGRDYLDWGVDNLKSPQWRKAFKDAQNQKVRTFNEQAVRKMANKIWREADWQYEDETGRYVEERVEAAREEAAREDKEHAIYTKYAALFGKSTDWLKNVYLKYDDEVTRSMFSSDEKFNQYIAFCAEMAKLWS